MRILNDNEDKNLNFITIYLTQEEIKEMINYLQNLSKHIGNNHVHMSAIDYKKEITLCKYNPDNLEGLDERSKILIKEDR